MDLDGISKFLRQTDARIGEWLKSFSDSSPQVFHLKNFNKWGASKVSYDITNSSGKEVTLYYFSFRSGYVNYILREGKSMRLKDIEWLFFINDEDCARTQLYPPHSTEMLDRTTYGHLLHSENEVCFLGMLSEEETNVKILFLNALDERLQKYPGFKKD